MRWTFFAWFGRLVDEHWGDVNGQYLILTGIFLVVSNAKLIHDASVSNLGQALVLAGVALLRPIARNNGGNPNASVPLPPTPAKPDSTAVDSGAIVATSVDPSK